MAESRHLLAYVRTSKVTDWKRIAFSQREDGKPVFLYRSDDEATFASYAKPDAVLWVIESHKRKPPSLVARMSIVGQVYGRVSVQVLAAEGQVDSSGDLLTSFEYGRKRRWYAFGDRANSHFYGHNDVSETLLGTTLGGEPAPWAGAVEWDPQFGWSLQRPRLLRSGQQEMEEFARALPRKTLFLSWKHCDFKADRARVRDVVDALVGEGLACWWDQTALPPSRALSRITKNPLLLGRLLDYGLRQSAALLALGSPNWGEPSAFRSDRNWTREEWARASRRIVYEVEGNPCHGWPDGPLRCFAREDTASFVAAGVKSLLRSSE